MIVLAVLLSEIYGKSCKTEEKSSDQLGSMEKVTDINEINASKGTQVLLNMNYECRREFENGGETVHNTQCVEC